jgi:hypothetical protein
MGGGTAKYGEVWAAAYDGLWANAKEAVRRPAVETVSPVPCHSNQNSSHRPAVGGGPRRARAMRAGRHAATAARATSRVRRGSALFKFNWPCLTDENSNF